MPRKIKIKGRLNFKSIKPVLEILAQEYIEWQQSKQAKKIKKSGNCFQMLNKGEVTV